MTVLIAVAERALRLPYRIWGFGEGMALLGLLRAGALLRRPQWIDFVAELVAPTLHGGPDPTDHLIPVEVLHELARLRPRLDTGPAVARFVDAVWRDGRPVPTHRPDQPDLASTIWVDCLHTDGPGLALAGRPSAAAAVVARGCAVLQDGTGLFNHGYDMVAGRTNGVHWGRGQGWALHGLVGVPGARVPGGPTDRLLAGLAATEVDGRWRTIVDDALAPVENSVSALVAAGIYHGLRSGGVDPGARPLADRALRAAVDALDADGGLPVSSATPAGDRPAYLDRPVGVHPWGQGPLLLALLAAGEVG